MDRGGGGEGYALGIQVAILHPVSSGGPHIGTDGTFSVADREHMLKQIFFLQDGSPQGKPTSQEGKTGRGMKQRNCFVMTNCSVMTTAVAVTSLGGSSEIELGKGEGKMLF